MKKLISAILLIAMVATLASCSQGALGGKDTTDGTTTPQVTSPNGFDDVTAPPEDTTEKPEETTEADTEETTEAPDDGITTADEAVAAARAWLGESDPDTGYKYAFSYDGTLTENGIEYFRVRVSWFIEEQERYSICGYLLVSPDGKVSKYSW